MRGLLGTNLLYMSLQGTTLLEESPHAESPQEETPLEMNLLVVNRQEKTLQGGTHLPKGLPLEEILLEENLLVEILLEETLLEENLL